MGLELVLRGVNDRKRRYGVGIRSNFMGHFSNVKYLRFSGVSKMRTKEEKKRIVAAVTELIQHHNMTYKHACDKYGISYSNYKSWVDVLSNPPGFKGCRKMDGKKVVDKEGLRGAI